MRLRLAIVAAATVTLPACGGGGSTSGTTRAVQTTVRAYFYRGAALVPVRIVVPATRATPAAALRALVAGPPRGYATALPSGARLHAVTLARGIARPVLAGPPGLAQLDRRGQAQIVYTLTQFPAVKGVDAPFLAPHGFLPLQDWTGESLTSPASRADYSDMTRGAPIYVASPLRGATVTSPVRVSGTARVFEGTILVDAYSGNSTHVQKIVTATAGAPERGRFDVTLALPPGAANIQLREPSPANGERILYMTEVGVTVTP